jgi:hypothetical protein
MDVEIMVNTAAGVPTDVINLGPTDWILDWAALVFEDFSPDDGRYTRQWWDRHNARILRSLAARRFHGASTTKSTTWIECDPSTLLRARSARPPVSEALMLGPAPGRDRTERWACCMCVWQAGRWCGASATGGKPTFPTLPLMMHTQRMPHQAIRCTNK